MDNKDRILLEGSPKTAFLYRIDGGMDRRDRDEIESMDSGYVVGRDWPAIVSDSVDLHHRMSYIRKRNLGFSFIKMADPEFENDLRAIDESLPVILAEMLSDFYRNGTRCVSDLLENVRRRNPADFKGIVESGIYEEIVGEFVYFLTGDPSEKDLDRFFFDRVPADRFGCASIIENKDNEYLTELILQVSFRA